jgi:hypothetical protein
LTVFLAGGESPRVRPVVVGLGSLASLEFGDLHQLLDEGQGQLWRGSCVNELHQMPYMSDCGPHSETGWGGIAALTHVLDDSLSPQRLVQLVGAYAGPCFEYRTFLSAQLDPYGTHIEAAR